jgi:N6-L-threonylcarbamoyladenine synthase
MINTAKDIVLLGIETSCDDTAAAVMVNGEIRSNRVATQEVHEEYGGVVPELASRKHQVNIIPVVDVALKEAGLTLSDLSGIAYTQGPGLLGSLLVGASFAKSLALSLNIPIIGVNHLHAHVMAHFIDEPKPKFPFLCLLVSGGHSQILRVDSPLESTILGQTLDDAAGEAFDKAAKMLDIPYPGGPEIDRLAEKGDGNKYKFPKPSVGKLDYSFSGFKTALLYFLRDEMKKDAQFIQKNKADLCASVQNYIVSYLLEKLKRAGDETQINEVCIAGGVSANSQLRKDFESLGKANNWNTYVPDFQYCTDNAAMIAMAGHFYYQASKFQSQSEAPYARIEI